MNVTDDGSEGDEDDQLENHLSGELIVYEDFVSSDMYYIISSDDFFIDIFMCRYV